MEQRETAAVPVVAFDKAAGNLATHHLCTGALAEDIASIWDTTRTGPEFGGPVRVFRGTYQNSIVLDELDYARFSGIICFC